VNLLTQAEADLSFILEDDVTGFGRPATLTEPDGTTVHNVVGQYIRVGLELDPGTGQMVATDKSALTVRIGSTSEDDVPVITGLGGAIPGAGWTVSTTDSTGAVVTGKIPKTGENVFPDRTLGRVTILFKAADNA
jgi:hypothetical protein